MLRDNFFRIKRWVIQRVLWAENEMEGRSGAEKKAIVVDRVLEMMVDTLPLPWFGRFAAQTAARPVVSWMVDLAVERLNFLSSWNFKSYELSEVLIAELACALDAPMDIISKSCGGSLEDNIQDLYHAYAICPAVNEDNIPSSIAEDAIILPATSIADNVLAVGRNGNAILTRKEIACRDNCGFDIMHWKMVETFRALRDFIDQPIHITSGNRCQDRNTAVRGAKNSQHMHGRALDMWTRGMTQRQLGEATRRADERGLLPHLKYCEFVGTGGTAIHMDVREGSVSRKFAF